MQALKEFLATTGGTLLAAAVVTMFSLFLVSRHITDAKPISFAELRDHVGEIAARANLSVRGILRLFLDVIATWWLLKARNPLGITDLLVSSATFALAVPTVLELVLLILKSFG